MKPQEKPLTELMASVQTALDELKAAELGRLPYCDDPDDGCDEVWAEVMKEFKRASETLTAWPFEPEGDR